jgi:hypothetical protein
LLAGPQLALQQSVSALQLSPSLWQTSHREPRSAEHVSPGQQESVVLVQVSLCAVHAPAIAPQVFCALHTPPQHSVAVAHGAPLR